MSLLLEQNEYEDERGSRISAGDIEHVGTFKYKCDGFFDWQCGKCGATHASRAFRINGVVFHCDGCGKKCLLLRSDVTYVTQAVQDAQRGQSRHAERTRTAVLKMSEAIMALNAPG